MVVETLTDAATPGLTDVLLIGGGIMSATLASLISELEPTWSIRVLERMDRPARESSGPWNNAGTGHSALCELNYTPQAEDGTVDISKAVVVNEQFQISRQLWSFLVESGHIPQPDAFIHATPHMSFVWGEENVAYHPAAPPLDPALAPLVDEVIASPRFTRTFDKLPCDIEMVDLANIVVCQNHVTHTFVEQLQERLGPAPDPASLFRFCLPMSDAPAPFRIREAGSKRYVFRSESTDFRFHEAVMLQADQLGGHDAFGAVAGALALVVGFSSNFLNAVRDDDRGRLLLHNGYHRACALLALGIRYAPCVVQTVTSRDELDIVAKALVANDPGYFFNAPRPPLLKDYLDPRIRKLIPIKKMSHVIEISYEIRDYFAEE